MSVVESRHRGKYASYPVRVIVRTAESPWGGVRCSATTTRCSESRYARHASSNEIPNVSLDDRSSKYGKTSPLDRSMNAPILSGPRVSDRYWNRSDPYAYAPFPLGHTGDWRLT